LENFLHNLPQEISNLITIFLFLYTVYNRITQNKRIEKIVEFKCDACDDRKEARLNSKVNKQIENAIKILNNIYSEIKQCFVDYCITKKIADATDIWKIDSFVRFEKLFNDAKDIMLFQLNGHYKVNNLIGLSAYEIEARCKNFWDILYSKYNNEYMMSPPSKDIVIDILLDKKQEIFEYFKSLYSKEMYEI
jgi:hypothetical protein